MAARPWIGTAAVPLVGNAALVAFSVCFLLDRPFWKPKNKGLIVGVIVSLASWFAYMGFSHAAH